MAKSPPPIVYIMLIGILGLAAWQLWRQGILLRPTGLMAERILLPDAQNPSKAAGARLLQQNDLAAAVPVLQTAVAANPNDPEARILLNNARARQKGDPLTLAVVVPTSVEPDTARETLRGVAQAQEAFGQRGGLQQRLLQVLIADDGNDRAQAEQVASMLVNQAEVLGVIGHNTSDASIAAAAIYQPAGLAMISSTSTSTAISDLGNAIFRTVPSDQFAGTQLARYALNVGKLDRAAIFFNRQSAYSNSLRTAFRTTFITEGGNVIQESDLAQDPTATIDRAASVVFLAPNAAVLP